MQVAAMYNKTHQFQGQKLEGQGHNAHDKRHKLQG